MPLLLNNFSLIASWWPFRSNPTLESHQQYTHTYETFLDFKNALPDKAYDQEELQAAQKSLDHAIDSPEQHMLENGRFTINTAKIITRNAIQNYVRQMSYKKTLKETGGNKEDAKKISDLIEYDFILYIQNSPSTNGKKLAEFVTQKLDKLLYQQLPQNVKPSAPPEEEEEENDDDNDCKNMCISCNKKFGPNKQPISLSCNHNNMCRGCAIEWFRDKQKTTCPSCRRTVDQYSLNQALLK